MSRKKSAKAILEELRGLYRDAEENFYNCGELADRCGVPVDSMVKDIVLRPDRPIWPETKAYRAAKTKLAATPDPH